MYILFKEYRHLKVCTVWKWQECALITYEQHVQQQQQINMAISEENGFSKNVEIRDGIGFGLMPATKSKTENKQHIFAAIHISSNLAN